MPSSIFLFATATALRTSLNAQQEQTYSRECETLFPFPQKNVYTEQALEENFLQYIYALFHLQEKEYTEKEDFLVLLHERKENAYHSLQQHHGSEEHLQIYL